MFWLHMMVQHLTKTLYVELPFLYIQSDCTHTVRLDASYLFSVSVHVIMEVIRLFICHLITGGNKHAEMFFCRFS